MDIRIDEEFKSLIKPLTNEEYAQLEKNLLEDGVRDPLVVWQGILVDGHNRYEIAQKHGLEFETVELDAETREDVKVWIIDNQLGRRNLQPIDRIDLAELKRDILEERARERQRKAGGDRKSDKYKASQEIASVQLDRSDFAEHKTSAASTKTVQVVTHDEEPHVAEVKVESRSTEPAVAIVEAYSADEIKEPVTSNRLEHKGAEPKKSKPNLTTRETLAKEAGVSNGMYARYEKVKKAKPELLDEVRNGNMTINGAYTAVKKEEKRKAKVEEVKKAQSYIESQSGEGSATLYVEDSVGITKPCDLLLTDPPYSTDVEDIDGFVGQWLYAALDGVKRDGFAYVFCGAYPEELRAYLNAKVPPHLHLEQLLVWEYKNTLGNNPRDRYKQNWQACLFYRGEDAPSLDCPLTNEQWAVQSVNAPDGRLGDRYHAWQKPLELMERFIRHTTKKGDTVYDPFSCTGTTLVAAAKLGRKGVGYEIDPANAEIAFERGVSRG